MKLHFKQSNIKIVTPLLFIFFCFVSHGQINIQWESRYDNAGALDQAVDMVIDAAGNVYVTGDSYDGTSFNIVTVKYNNAGVQQWVAEFDGAANGVDQAGGIVIDNNGDVFITGYTFTGSGNDYDMVTEKYSGVDGSLMWNQIYTGTNNFDFSKDIVIDSQQDVYITGQLEAGSGDINMVTVKYNNAGTFQWDDTYNSSGSDFDSPVCLAMDGSDNIYMVGYSENGSDETDYLIRKYNSAGAIQWTQRYDNANGPDEPRTAVYDPANDRVLITGSTFITTAFKLDYWTLSLDASNGAMVWDMNYNGTETDDDIPTGIDVDLAGNTYITGKSKGIGTNFDYVTIRYDVDGTEHWVDRFQISGNGLDNPTDVFASDNGDLFITGYSYNGSTNNDYLTIKYDTLGGVIWSTRFDGPASNVDNALAMAVDPTGNIYVTGNSQGASTNWDYSTIKYCQHKTNAGIDTSLCVGENVQMNATASGGSNFTWSVVSGDPINVGANFSCNPCNNPVISPAVTTVYAVSSENANGCVDFDTVEVVVNPLPGPTIYTSGATSFCLGDSVQLWTDSTSGYTWSDGSTTIGMDSLITVFQSGTYSVTVEDSMGCQNTTNELVTVFQPPTLSFATVTPFCSGDSTQLEVSGAVDYEWYADPSLSDTSIFNPYASPSTTTTYQVIGTDVNGCKDTADVTATVFAIPAQPTITRLNCDSLQSSYFNGNQWYMNGFMLPSETDPILRMFYDGDYYIRYTDNNGCEVWSDTIIVREIDTCLTDTTDNGVGITAYSENTMKVYPNPALDIVNIEFNSAFNGDLFVFTISGQMVRQKAIKTEQFVRMNISDLPQGVYILRLQSKNGEYMVKKLTVN